MKPTVINIQYAVNHKTKDIYCSLPNNPEKAKKWVKTNLGLVGNNRLLVNGGLYE